MKECCRTCEWHYPEQEGSYALAYELSRGDVCIMCDETDDDTHYDPNSSCKYYKYAPQQENCCRLCQHYRPTPIDEYEGENATIYSCRGLIVPDFEGTCPKFEPWDEVYNAEDN